MRDFNKLITIPELEGKKYLINEKISIKILIMKIDFTKGNGLVPVVIQDNNTLQVLMVGYMNEEAFKKTRKKRK